ncbi:MAG: hypothetical protein GF344_18390, partial [Chitinivibrionales bacterium]|nr:hypothetical protein [Chitinivibrionales bacterium]MBD3358624.1 hypothetical protein [Chitinivibrionales bacterium]
MGLCGVGMAVGLTVSVLAANPVDSGTVAEGGVPVAKIGESVICCPKDDVRFDGWASIDVGGEVDAWLWDLDGDGEIDTTCAGGELRTIAPEKPGSYNVFLYVRDNEKNLSAPDTSTLHVLSGPPRVEMGSDTTVK